MTYDLADHLLSLKDGDPLLGLTEYTYDERGLMRSQTYPPNGNTTMDETTMTMDTYFVYKFRARLSRRARAVSSKEMRMGR